VSIVFACALSVDAYVDLGRDVEVPRPNCPACSDAMGFWGFYRRDIRVGAVFKVLLRRVRCRSCRTSHAMLPDFVVHGRLDGIEVIGGGIDAMASPGAGARSVAAVIGVPHTTVRDWRRRVASRAPMLTAGFWASCVALGDLVPRVVGTGALSVLCAAITAVVAAARRRLGAQGTHWRIANRIIGGHLISTNTNPPWAGGLSVEFHASGTAKVVGQGGMTTWTTITTSAWRSFDTR
jgi:hypothetical protein